MSLDKIDYVQCKLEKWVVSSLPSGGFYRMTDISFIPEEFAVLNNKIKLKNEDDTWDDNWIVSEVYSNTKTKEPPDWRKLIRGHRKNTGDSQPKERNDL